MKTLIIGEELGNRDITDYLTVSLSSTDYIGHLLGPNSIEHEDTVYKVDKHIGDILDTLKDENGVDIDDMFIIFTGDHGMGDITAKNQEEGFDYSLNLDLIDLFQYCSHLYECRWQFFEPKKLRNACVRKSVTSI